MVRICTHLLHSIKLRGTQSETELVDIIDQSRIPIGKIPDTSVLKMMKSEHAKLLLEDGMLRLGSIDFYRRHTNPEVLDKHEGLCMVVAYDGEQTEIRMIRGGLSDRLFCCYAGTPDKEVIELFGYDAAVEITDIEAFARLIQKTLGSNRHYFSSCLYVQDRVLYGQVSESFNVEMRLNREFADLIGQGRAFLKHNNYRHQREFRFLWTCAAPLQEYIDISIPGIQKCCRRVEVSKVDPRTL